MDELTTSIFKVTSSTPYDKSTKFYRIECPQWVNVVALTSNREVVLVEQYRYGVDHVTLELPAGKMDSCDKDPMETAKRELLEETGYGGGEWYSLGFIHPNPAIQNNRCYNFLAENVSQIAPLKNDLHENTKPVCVPISRIDSLILDGKITHSLAISAIYLYQKNTKRYGEYKK